MKKTKIVSYLLSAVIAFGLVPNAMAEETPVYTYDDNNGETVNVTQSELIAGNWNVDYMSHLPVEQFEDFPVKLDKQVYGNAQLRINATYLKNVRADEEVNFSVVDRNTNEVFYSQNFTANTEDLEIENIPMDKTFNLIVKSVYEGIETQNVAVIETYYGKATMPNNISISEMITENPAEVRIKDMTLGTVFEEDENGNAVLNRNVTYIQSSELKGYYDAINDNHLYNVQTNQDGELYKGYMTKNPEYSCDYVFSPRYDYYLEEDYIIAATMPSTFASDPEVYQPYVDYVLADGMYAVENFTDQWVRLNSNRIARAYQIYLPVTGEYRFKTYSNGYNEIYYATSTTSSSFDANTEWRAVADASVGKSMIYAEDQWLFIICSANYALTDVVLNVQCNGSTDNVCNFIHQTNAENTFATMDTVLNYALEYPGDVDVFMPNCTLDGYYSVLLSSSVNRKIELTTYAIDDDGYAFYEEYDTVNIQTGESVLIDYSWPVSTNTRYFMLVKNNPLSLGIGNYTIEIRSTSCPDQYENNNSETYATDLLTLTSPLQNATMGVGDKDYYKFTVGAGGADVEIRASATCDHAALKNMILYAQNSDVYITGETVNGENVIQTTVPGNDTYILWMRLNKNSQYCPGHPYILSWTISEPYSAVVNSPVSLTATAGGVNMQLLLLAMTASSMSFYDNGTSVNAQTAMANLKLYYIDNDVKTELTQEALDSLGVGVYNLTAEYYGVQATGETITLTVS